MLDPVTRMIAARRRADAADRPAGAALYLCTLGLVAAVTIGAFFGLGLALLMPHPLAQVDRPTASTMAAGMSTAARRHALPAAASAPEAIVGSFGAHPAPSPPEPIAPVSAAPAPAARPERPTAIGALLAEGDELFRQGDVAGARLRYRQAFDRGAARGALGIGATYDPGFLNRGGRHGLAGDPAVARFWYRAASAMGAPEAERRIALLPAPSHH
jgi:hypothetical protein